MPESSTIPRKAESIKSFHDYRVSVSPWIRFAAKRARFPIHRFIAIRLRDMFNNRETRPGNSRYRWKIGIVRTDWRVDYHRWRSNTYFGRIREKWTDYFGFEILKISRGIRANEFPFVEFIFIQVRLLGIVKIIKVSVAWRTSEFVSNREIFVTLYYIKFSFISFHCIDQMNFNFFFF